MVQPRRTLRHTSLTAPDPIGMLLGDHDGLSRLAGLFAFAACSRRTIVHVPLRDGVPPDARRVGQVRGRLGEDAPAAEEEERAGVRGVPQRVPEVRALPLPAPCLGGPRQKRVHTGRSALMSALPALIQPPGGGHPAEVLVCFKPCPPCGRFKRPGRPASRRRPTAASP